MKVYRCERCDSHVSQERVPEDDGKTAWWYRCQNPTCGKFYGQPVYEKDLEFHGTLDVYDLPLEPWFDSLRRVA